MGGRSYSKKRARVSPSTPMETNYINPNPEAADQDTHLSGAYIRNLVKQLATSNSLSPSPSPLSSASPPPTPPKTHQKPLSNAPHKKQVRRRLHTTKPYQERLLNMAEARKEIVTALKFHRATMKQQQQSQQQTLISPPQFQETTPTPELVLPNQTLGLNLSSFQDLTNLDAACLYSVTADDTTSSTLPDAALTSPSAAPAAATGEQGLVGSRALGDLEMEEIKSIGEMHEMEWNDTLNLANSAWWFKFLNNEEFEQEFDNLSPTLVCNDRQFEQAVELPLCWEGNYDPNYSTSDGNFFQSRHLELPCMNIEDIEGLDEEWLC